LPHWSPSLVGILGIYFTTNYILAGIVIAALALSGSFAVFAFSKNHGRKSRSMLSAILISSSLWVFIISSIVLCAGLMGEYHRSPADAVLSIARYALVPAVLLGPIVFYLLRNRAMKQLYPFFTSTLKAGNDSELIDSKVSSLFSGLVRTAKLSGISLSVVSGGPGLPDSAALDWRGEKMVAISARSVLALDDDELRAVLAHELGHIVHRDSLRKTIATIYRTAFIFDPVAYFVEAAIYRDGELYADEYSARLTGKPAALASALIKIHESMKAPAPRIPEPQTMSSYLLDDHEANIFSKQPSLTLRIKKLLEMEDEVERSSGPVKREEDRAVV
jgi:heat shock protein HtpX